MYAMLLMLCYMYVYTYVRTYSYHGSTSIPVSFIANFRNNTVEWRLTPLYTTYIDPWHLVCPSHTVNNLIDHKLYASPMATKRKG